MTDAQMSNTEATVNSYPTWDFVVKDGKVPYITGDDADKQAAEVACFMQRGTVAQLPNIGVDWLSFFMQTITFGDLDAMIQQSMLNAGIKNYFPNYSSTGDKLLLTLQRRT
jgi:hypothetical protein